jgi:seryl-tRNA synthetase
MPSLHKLNIKVGNIRKLRAPFAGPGSCNTRPFFAAASASTTEPRTAETNSTTANHHDGHKSGFRAYIDFKFVRDNVELLTANCANRNTDAHPQKVAELYDAYVALQQETDALRNARNENSNAMKGKLEAEKRAELIENGKKFKEQLESLESRLSEVEEALQREGQRLPNLAHPDAPVGGEEEAAVIQLVGEKPNFSFQTKGHIDIGQDLDIIDFETASAVSGTKFYYLKREAALLEIALISYAMSKVSSKGFIPMIVPDLVRDSVIEKCGFQPRAANTQVYSIQNTDLCLAGTAEIPLGGVYMDAILSEADLPIKMAAFSHCFRTEAGAAGAATRGLYRVHQFSKVELFMLSTPEQSEQLHKELLDLEVEMFSELGLHFKVLDMPTGDLGAPAYRKYDIEAWMPGMERYGEISSASNCTDYQARRLNIRYRPESITTAGGEKGGSGSDSNNKKKKGGGKKVPTAFVHTLNATACAVPRMIIAILEMYQKEDGTVEVPAALRPFMGGKEVILGKAR